MVIDPKLILDLPMESNDAGASTVREYLSMLLLQVWNQEESFSGKRPFGNSGWQSELIVPLVRAKFVEGSIDEWGTPRTNEPWRVDDLIVAAIKALGETN